MQSLEDRIGNTPLFPLTRFARALGLSALLLGKAEWFNPGGSVKDRTALFILRDAERRGLLRSGSTIIEATSGSMGVSLAMLGASRGYRVALTMPDTMSVERRALLRAYGAQLHLTDGALGMAGAVALAGRLAAETPQCFVPNQFSNPANPDAHRQTTGPELWRDTGGAIDVLVAGVGSGGTLTGTAEYVKRRKSALRVVAVEPAASPVLSGGQPGAHDLMGIGAGFVPDTLNAALMDEVIAVSEPDAYVAARLLAREEGLLVGVSAGAALHAATVIARRPEYRDRVIAVILPDGGERYFSTPLWRATASKDAH